MFEDHCDCFLFNIIRTPEAGEIIGKQRREREIEEAHRVFSCVFSRPHDLFSKRTVFVPVFGGIDWFNVWSAAYLGDLCLIAGTVIRSDGCAVIGISVALLFLSREVHSII